MADTAETKTKGAVKGGTMAGGHYDPGHGPKTA